MTPALQTAAASLIMQIEGVRLTGYRDTGGVVTIGVGHTGNVIEGSHVTIAQAMDLLKQDLAPIFAALDKAGVTTSGKVLAYASFGFNCGVGALGKVLAGQDRIDNPRHTRDARGNVLPGLLSRRNLEVALLAV